MADVDVVAVLVAKPGSEHTVEAALTALVPPTRAEEGCRDYRLYRSTADPTTFFTIERWSDPGDLERHLATAHVQQALAAAGEHLQAAPAVHPLTEIVVG